MYIRDYLSSRQIGFETMLHAPAPSASRVAQSLHVPGRRVAKVVLIRAGGDFVLTVLPSTARVDLDRLSRVLDGIPVRLATEEEVEGVFSDCERGALPPFGRLYGLRTLVETSLAEGGQIVFTGNQRHEGVRLSYADFESLEAPTRAAFAATEPDPHHTPHRRAG